MNSVVTAKLERLMRMRIDAFQRTPGYKMKVEAEFHGYKCVLYSKDRKMRFEGHGASIEDAIENCVMKASG